MRALSLTHKLPGCSSTVALTLLIGALNASALTAVPAAGSPATATTPAKTQPHPGNLMPGTPGSSQVSSADGDIRDIRQPRHVPTVPPWSAAAAGVIVVSAAAFAVWRWLGRGKFRQVQPHEIALRYLEEARQLMDPDHAREYCFAVSNIIRDYVEERFYVHAPRLTTEEFLRDLVEVRNTMLEPHRNLLGEFLDHCDLAKFAGWRYSMPALEAMHASARSFVQHTAIDTARTAAKTGKSQPAVATN
jgi:hypothetical protein